MRHIITSNDLGERSMRTYFKWSLSKLVLILGLMLGASGVVAVQGAAPAFAQDSNVIKNSEFGAELKRPDGWEDGKGNEKALANKHGCRMVRFQVETQGTQVSLRAVLIR